MNRLRPSSWEAGELDYRHRRPNVEPPAVAPDPCHVANGGAGKGGLHTEPFECGGQSP